MTDDTVKVPREPTHTMLAMAEDVVWQHCGGYDFPLGFPRSMVSQIYRAMLAAAPSTDGGREE